MILKASELNIYVTDLQEPRRRPRPYVTICGGKDRAKQVFTSDSNEIKIKIETLHGSDDQKVHFLLKYEGESDNILVICSSKLRKSEIS